MRVKAESIRYLRCPSCGNALTLESKDQGKREILLGALVCESCGQGYEIRYGLPNLVHPKAQDLPEIDAQFLKQYERVASSYDRTIRLMLLLLGIWEPRTRRDDLIAPLDLKAGATVLEVSAGTGSNLPIIAHQIDEGGRLFALDLSPGMLAVARQKAVRKGLSVDFVLGNGAYLPYADETFDAVFHFGGINTFGEKERAIAEMTRVAKPGAKIVIGDEGLAPGREKTWFGRRMLKMNSLYANKPPMDLLPGNVEELHLRWIWRGLFYAIDFAKAAR